MFLPRARLAFDMAIGVPALTPSIAINFEHCNVRPQVFVVCGPVRAAGLRTFTVRRFAKLPDRQRWATVRPEKRCLPLHLKEFSRQKDKVMKASSHAADYYRRILSAQPHGLKRLDPVAAIMHCHRGQEIPESSAPAGHWYCVIVGAVRHCTIRSDGRRQIVDLMLPRDFFFVSDSKRDGTTEAVVEETVLASYPGARMEQLAERDPLFARELREVALQSLTRSQDQLQIVGGVNALEKVGSFLLSLDGRGSEKRGQVELPVSRYDIADYLAVSVETVCRAITDLQHRGVIALADKRTVKILNRGALEDRFGERAMVA
jgi:CRP/FNR family transcriptional regulator, nitrogen fixation regulation protein